MRGETRGRGRPRKDMVLNDGDTTARKETEETTQRRKAHEEGQEAVTTMVNYVAATTWWNTATWGKVSNFFIFSPYRGG